MIAKVPIYILFVALTKSEIIVGYSFIICIHQFEKCVLFILLLILTQTNKHKKKPTHIQFDVCHSGRKWKKA